METRAAYAVVGGFVLALIAGLVVAALWVAHGQFTKAQTRYDIYFASVTTGLIDGSVVQISGVQVGRVVEVALDPANPQRVRVTVEVKSDSPIRSDSVASIDIQTLTGTAAVAISPGSSAAPPIELSDDQRYAVIWSRDSEIQKVVATIPDLLAKITNLSDRLGNVVDDRNRAALAATLDNLSRISSAVAARSGDLDRFIADGAADARELHEVIANMNHAMRRVDEVTAQAGASFSDFDKLVKDNQGPIKDFTQNGLGELRELLARTQ